MARIQQLPMVWRPIANLADWRWRQVRQQLRKVMLRINAVPAAGAGQAGKDRRSLADTMSAVARDLNNGNGVTRVVNPYHVFDFTL
jgi:hypothetical protein